MTRGEMALFSFPFSSHVADWIGLDQNSTGVSRDTEAGTAPTPSI